MSRNQWGHGWHKGHEQGEWEGEMLGYGAAQVQYGPLAERLTLLTRGLRHEANHGGKSSAWWMLYASVLATQLEEIASNLPGVLAHFEEHVPPEDQPATTSQSV